MGRQHGQEKTETETEIEIEIEIEKGGAVSTSVSSRFASSLAFHSEQ
jgi:hypothetical protein